MKKQHNSSIKAHLIRGAFYLLLLLAVCAIPFALAQRNTTKRRVGSRIATAPVAPEAAQGMNRWASNLPRFSSASHGRMPFGPKTTRLLRSLLPNSIYMIDDGTSEDAVGFGNGSTNSESLWMNQFDVISGQTMISTVSVAWGTPVNPDPSLNGIPVTIAVWSDPNGDGDPTDGLLLGSVTGTVQNAGTDTFVDYTFNPPIDVSAYTSFFIGDMTPSSTDVERFFQAIDENGTLHRQSWVVAMSSGGPVDINTLGNNDLIGIIDDLGIPGNWLIRGDTAGGASPTPTPTGTPSSCSWAGAPDMPSTDARSVGVFFADNGKFYVMGGRDLNNVELTNPLEYDPATNSWTTKSAAYPDAFTNNMACGILNDSGTNYIYCAGGSNFASQTTSGRVFRYDPVADAISTVSSDFPPGDAGDLPGGFTVFNNKLYTLGGFDIPNGVGIDQIWEFTPDPAGWMQKGATLPVPLGYLPTTTIGNLIYTGGGADITGGTLTDTQNSFVYDPVADSISTIAQIPRPTSNTRAVNFCNLMYVLGGGFTTPSNEVDIYDPASDTWSLGAPFPTAGRNFAADTDGTNNIWKAGGYASDGATIIATTEAFNCPVSPCASPSPTPTATATPTPSGTPTPTATATATATGTPTGTRPTPTPRTRPTPAPRP
jgi:N-acetylneuraminic acid mutarotase